MGYLDPQTATNLRRNGAYAIIVSLVMMTAGIAHSQTTTPIKDRNVSASRGKATSLPRSEGDQAIVDGWPLYRTERGQTSFNDAMATLKATDTTPPEAAAFRGCEGLACTISLPAAGADGWLQPGRLWVSPTEYVIIAHSPRLRQGQSYRRRPIMGLRVFVFHEFHNSSRNVDPYDTISSHSGSVFVPLYMSKTGVDARGQRYVVIVQVAPYDVVSIHATNHGSAGPGIEVARNVSDSVEPLQNTAGILVATMVKTAVPRIQVVNHRGAEGQPMLQAYERRIAAARSNGSAAPLALALPFTPAPAQKVASVTARLDEVISRGGASARIPVADRGILPRRGSLTPTTVAAPAPATEPQLVGAVQLARRPARTATEAPIAAPALATSSGAVTLVPVKPTPFPDGATNR